MPINIKDIAKELGISAMTVSRALNNKGRINSKTRSKILSTAERMGYVPNALARGLVLNKTFTIGMVISNIANPFYASIARVVQKEATARGYRLILLNTDENTDREKEALYSLRELRCDGALLTPTEQDYSHIVESVHSGMPIVLINRRPDKVKMDFVVCDNVKGAYLATTHLLELGHRRIAHITGPSYITSVAEKIKGYKTAFADRDLEPDPDLIFQTELTLEGAYQKTLDILDHHGDTTAVFAYSDRMSIGIMKALMEKQRNIPGDISIVGYDNIDISPYMRVPLTTVELPTGLLGKQALEILFKKMEEAGKSSDIVARVLPPKLIERQSCRKIG
jgi:LacI family transcriptional regulator